MTSCHVRYLEAGPLIGLSRGCHGRSYVVNSGRSTAGISGHLNVLETFREDENTIVAAGRMTYLEISLAEVT